ncbi:unannotated protein [freshwater metagenome]|uniref:Unannotated protein n=1 Tax=freshwater metagenome TaxID=449393 RepID=A0A6J7EIW1_9ZZZZ
MQYVYGIDGNHHAHVARANDNGTTTEIGTMGGTISGQFTVLQEPSGKWWMVGQLPFLSRRVVAYPLSGPAGKVTGAGLKLITLPSPGPTRYTYAGTVHPELNGLLTWAVNGSGAGTPYGLQRQAAFWPLALTYAKAAAAATAAAKAKIAIAGTAGNTVKIWATSKQKELENELATNAELDLTQNWLAPLPDPLSPDLSIPSSSAPAAWEMSGRASDPSQPAGEDSDTGGDFIVPETSAGYKAQQTLARAADSAAKASVKAAAAQTKAAEAAKAAVERQAEANKQAAEALGQQAKLAAEKAAEQAKLAAEKAQAAAEKALEKAKNEAAKAAEALKQANGKGRTNWGVLAPTNAFSRLARIG